jgi:hypothetical protein
MTQIQSGDGECVNPVEKDLRHTKKLKLFH